MRSDPFPQKKLRTPYSNLHVYEDPEVPEVHIVVEPDGGGGGISLTFSGPGVGCWCSKRIGSRRTKPIF